MVRIEDLEKKYIINTYNRQPGVVPCFVKGEGSYLWDEEGKKYLDFLSGLAVNVTGHCHEKVVKAIQEQVALLSHTSNLYYTGPQALLAQKLVENTLIGGKVFFANSGAEANEAAIKLARKNKPGCYKIITAERSFHGRTMATLTATGQPKYQKPFVPLLESFSYGIFNDLDSFEALIDDKTAAIMIEPIQGEGGVYAAEKAFLKGLRDLCTKKDILLIFDEVQCGMGRTGKLWAFEHYDLKPDLVTVAKGLGGGLPIGALIAAEKYAAVLKPGEHASTFGGNPVVCAAALAVLEIILAEGFLAEVKNKGQILEEGLKDILQQNEVKGAGYRGLGLMCAIETGELVAKNIYDYCLKEGLLLNAIGEHTLRLLPPLTISTGELKEGLVIIQKALKEALLEGGI